MSNANAGRYVRKEMTPLAPIRLASNEVFPTIDEAYASLRSVTDADPLYGAAWKLGGTTATTRRIFDVERLYFGPLHETEILRESERAPARLLFELKGEAEISLRISPVATSYLSKGRPALADAPTGELFDAWCVALELPSSPISNLVEAGVTALVADRCAAGSLVLGPVHPLSNDEIAGWRGATLRIEQDGVVIAEGGTDALVSPPQLCARDFLDEALAHGFMPKPGQWISTGGLTPCVALTTGARVSIIYNETPALRFTVEDGAS